MYSQKVEGLDNKISTKKLPALTPKSGRESPSPTLKFVLVPLHKVIKSKSTRKFLYSSATDDGGD